MFRPLKKPQVAIFLKETGKILPTALLALCLAAPVLKADTKADGLETRIWTSDLEDYSSLEKAAVRALQLKSGAYEHYLVAELSFRMFKQTPQDLRLLKQASDMAQQAIELAPDQEYGYLVAAQIMDLMGYKDEASDMLKSRPSFRQGWRSAFVRAVIASTHEGDKSSFGEFERSLKAPDASKELVGAYLSQNLESEFTGNELVQKLELWNRKADSSAMRLSLAKALDESGDAVRAQQVLNGLNKTQASDESELLEATLLYNRLQKPKEAEALLKKIIAGATHDEIRNQAKAHLAKIDLQKGDMRSAARLFSESIEATDAKLKWIAFAHNAYKEKQKLVDFSLLLNYLSTQLPGSGYVYALQGEILSENLAMHEKAVESYEAAITLDPRRSEFYNGMGLAYYRMQKHEKALAVFAKALKIDPKDATARYNEACVLALMGRNEEAVGSLGMAISLDGRLSKAALTDKDFEGIRANAQFQSLVRLGTETVLTKSP